MHTKQTSTTKHLSVLGLLAATALALSACSGAEEASAEDTEIITETIEDPAPDSVAAPAGLIHHGISHEAVTTTETLIPERDQIITPAGTLFIESVEAADYVSIAEVDMDTSEGQQLDIEEAPTDVHPADGEVFRVIEFKFMPYPWDAYEPRTATFTLDNDGQQHIMELETDHQERLLISVPEHEDTQFAVASEGHTQHFDALTGERLTEDTDPAASFYRHIKDEDINHAFHIEDDAVQVIGISGTNNAAEDADVEYDMRVRTASLTGWTPQDGWAPEGQAWLSITWDYNISTDFLSGLGASLLETTLTLNAEMPDGTTAEDRIINERWSHEDEALSVMAIPSDTTDLTLSIDGTTEFSMDDLNYEVVAGQETTLDIATDSYEIQLPDDTPSTDADSNDQ